MAEAVTLVVNTGSSSLKLGLYGQQEEGPRLLFDLLADNVAHPDGTLTLRDGDGKTLRSEPAQFANQQEAMRTATEWLAAVSAPKPTAIGHRVVHGGPKLVQHQRITPELMEELRGCVHFAPLHIPLALALMEEGERGYPDVPQFACFDTAFHRTMPELASRFALPGELFDAGIRRYGFHGLSYESIVHSLGDALPSRTVMAHLGSGAGLAAVKDGCSIDTSMGLTPTGGVPMATRSGDLDPGVLLYMQRARGMDADALEELLNKGAGLKAISGGTSDMRTLETAANAGDAKAALAIDIFCAAISKTVAAYATALGGLDMLVFAGGIGEHSAMVRQRVCDRLAWMGVGLDAAANQAHAVVLSAMESKVLVRIVASEEDLQIARHCADLMHAKA